MLLGSSLAKKKRTLSRPDVKKEKEREKKNKLTEKRSKTKLRNTAATRDDLNFLMDRSFILEWNKRQICHPTEHCVCS